MYAVDKTDDCTIIRTSKPKAEIELNNVNQLKELFEKLISEKTPKILIDFRYVVYIDSAGLGVLLDAMKKIKNHNGELGILSVSKDILEVFTATKIAQYFKFYKSI